MKQEKNIGRLKKNDIDSVFSMKMSRQKSIKKFNKRQRTKNKRGRTKPKNKIHN